MVAGVKCTEIKQQTPSFKIYTSSVESLNFTKSKIFILMLNPSAIGLTTLMLII